MRKVIKYLLIVLCCVMVSGCSGQSDIETITPTESPQLSVIPSQTAVPTASPVITKPEKAKTNIVVFRSNLVIQGDAKDYLIDWQLLLQEKFNVRIIVHDLLSYGKNWARTNGEINLLAESGENVFEEIQTFSQSQKIKSFSDYLQNSKSWDEFPEDFKNAYKDTSGNIWGIPKGDSAAVFARAYNKEWLETIKKTPPKNVDELYDVMRMFTFNDPDKNGVADTFGTAVTKRSTALHCFKDVFEAYGCRLSYSFSHQIRNGLSVTEYQSVPVGYNPNNDIIEDSSGSSGMLDSLVFIKGLLDNGIIKSDINNMSAGLFTKPMYGSQMGISKDNLMNTGTYDYTFTLSEPSVNRTSSLPVENRAYYLYSGFADPETAVSTFIDTFYGSKEGFKFAFTGLMGHYFKYMEKDDGLVVNEWADDRFTHINLLDGLSWFDLNVSRPNLNENFSIVDAEELLNDSRMFKLLPRQMAFLENMNALPTENSGGSGKYEKATIRLFEEFYKGSFSPEVMMDELKKIHEIYNIDELIKKTNEKWITANN